MDPLIFVLIATVILGVVSYGVTLTPLELRAKQIAHLGLTCIYLLILTRHFGLL